MSLQTYGNLVKHLGQYGMHNLFSGIYKNKKVFVTGHTGFKGSWLCYWLLQMDATVKGYSLNPETTPNHFDLLDISNQMESIISDIRDIKTLKKHIDEFQPDIIFHLAAQPLVRDSYRIPVETFETNIMGTVNVLEASRGIKSLKAIVNVTSDKCYENIEKDYAYIESDSMGGYDPYSASKGCAELIASSYRNSFFNIDKFGVDHTVLLASCRAGNVIGGGDWAKDRLIPDIIKASNNKSKVMIRSPRSIRPWQHVLEPLSGYLYIGQLLLESKKEHAEGWNFGPDKSSILTVEEVVEKSKNIWNNVIYELNKNNEDLHEAKLLTLDCSKALTEINWHSVWSFDDCIKHTITWYKDFYEKNECNTASDLLYYVNIAKEKGMRWAND